jgi:predicted Zn-dependent protease
MRASHLTVETAMLLGLILALLLSFSGCETNPYTGRSQFLMTSVSDEMKMGAQAYGQVKSDPKMKPSQDPREIEPVKRVAARIVEAAKRSKYAEMARQFEWEVTVIKDDKTANAFALPGGKMAVYTGIFPMAKTEAGLAAVMGSRSRPCVGAAWSRADESRAGRDYRGASAWNSRRRGNRQRRAWTGHHGCLGCGCSGWHVAAV